jgi:hypothetical protein
VKPDTVIKIHTNKKTEKYANPSDSEILKLRREGKKVPKKLLLKKFAHNKARHVKDIKK